MPFCSAERGGRKISKLNKTREELAELFLQSLSEERLPWNQPWVNSGPGLFDSINAITQKQYRGINALRLWVESIQKQYADPRWCTYRQASGKGWQVRRGEKGTPVELWKVYDRKEKMSLDFAEYHRILAADPDRGGDFQIYAKTFVVFNGQQIEGIPALPQENHIPPEYKNEMLASFAENYLSAERIPLERAGYAAYTPSRDCLKMPDKDAFHSEMGYYETLFHEIAHSTGHETRLNRPLLNGGDIEAYANEELRAEIGSAFLLSAAKCDVPDSVTENNKAYIQNWAANIKDKPDALFAAIKDAGAICDFVSERGQLPALLERYRQEQDVLDEFSPDVFEISPPAEETAEALAM